MFVCDDVLVLFVLCVLVVCDWFCWYEFVVVTCLVRVACFVRFVFCLVDVRCV